MVVVGAGAAGLYVALRAAEEGSRVALVSRKRLAETVTENASYWAQGGLAAALAPDDSTQRPKGVKPDDIEATCKDAEGGAPALPLRLIRPRLIAEQRADFPLPA